MTAALTLSMSTSQHLNRHEKGTYQAGKAKGGKFAEKRRTEAAAAALAGNTREFEQDMRDALEYFPHIVNGSWMNHDEVLNSREDIRQEAAIRLMVWAKDNDKSNLVADHGGMMRTMLSQEVQKVFNAGEHHTAAAGRVALQKALMDIQSTLGVTLSSKERKELADEIRLSFPPGRRPKVGYERHRKDEENNHSFSGEEPDAGHEDIRAFIATEDLMPWDKDERERQLSEGDSRAFGRAVDRVELQVESVVTAKQTLWEVFNESNSNIPTPKPVAAEARAQVSKSMKKHKGGPHGASQRFLDGLSTPQEDSDLFAPFGGYESLSEDQRDAIAEKIAGNPPTRAKKIWDLALDPADQS